MRVHHDPLWPVMMALVFLLASTLSLEHFARSRELTGTLIRISRGAETSMPAELDDDSGEEEAEFELQTAVNDAHEHARLLCRRGQLEGCLEQFEALAKEHAGSALVHAEYGYWLLRAKRPTEAEHELELARTLDPSSPLIALNLGSARRRSGDDAGAEQQFRLALELKPNYGSAKLALGQLLRVRGALPESIQVLESAAASGSNELRARALCMLGKSYLASGRRADAERAFASGIERAPSSVELRLRMARAYLASGKLGDKTRALELAADAASMAPEDAEVMTSVARVRDRTGDREGARRAFERAVQLDPKNRYAARRLLRLALDGEDFEEAQRCAVKLLELDAEEPEHHFLAGLVAARKGETSRAREHYQNAIDKSRGDYPEAFFNLGLLEKRDGELERSIAAYREAVRLRPAYVAAWNNLGVALAADKQESEAEAAYKSAITADGNYAPAWQNLAELLQRVGRPDDAVLALEHAARLRPTDADVRLALGTARQATGKLQAALTDFRTLTEQHPRNARAWFALSQALLTNRDPAAARSAVRRAIELDPDQSEYLSLSAHIELALGHLPEARATYEDVLDHMPSDHSVRLALADVLRQSGDRAGCEREVERVLDAAPDDPRAQASKRGCGEANKPH